MLVEAVGLDVIVDALEALVALQKLVSLIRILEMGESLPFDVEALEGGWRQKISWERREGRTAVETYNDFGPKILRIVFATLFAGVAQDGLDLVGLLVLGRVVDVVSGVGTKVLKILGVVDIVGNFAAAAGTSHLLACNTRPFLLL